MGLWLLYEGLGSPELVLLEVRAVNCTVCNKETMNTSNSCKDITTLMSVSLVWEHIDAALVLAGAPSAC